LPEITLFPQLLENKPEIKGLNVTIPYKQAVIPYLDKIDPAAARIGAVNVIRIEDNGHKTGYNSDYFGFTQSLLDWFRALHGEKGEITLKNLKALILGTGGASKAVKTALDDLAIESIFVSRQPAQGQLSYEKLNENIFKEYALTINTTPLGTYPQVEAFPPIPYRYINSNNYLYDLVYNPEETTFMKKGKENGAYTLNGLPMLYAQAEKSWEIWNA
jgi:shikimate dehydrogenase